MRRLPNITSYVTGTKSPRKNIFFVNLILDNIVNQDYDYGKNISE